MDRSPMVHEPGGDHWQRLEALFHAALDIEPDRRGAFLSEECAGDGELRREVELLLDSSRQTWGFFQRPVKDTAQQVANTPDATVRIGQYRIIRLIGEGGMGRVYLAARDDKLYEQQVAIKVVQTRADRMGDLLMRFSTERQILANLVHPNIARLFDAGIAPDASPYLVMEYIEGAPIDEYVTGRKLSINDRLELFQTICSAVEYAHRNLVVHRDIKPGNILVTQESIPKLLDFGIAKLLQSSAGPEAAITRASDRLMTPEYASPEQVRGLPVTTSADVYALGGLLYVLLTGRPPFKLDTRDPLEVANIICERPPTRPSAAALELAALPRNEDTKLKGDLDNIVLKALRKEPEKRYASVAELSEDVRRYLEGYPLQAGSGASRYRAGKFIRRHKLAVAASLLMTVAIIGFSAGMGILAQRARKERSKAEQEAGFLSGLFRSATPDVERGKTVTARDVLDLAARRIDRESGAGPEVQASLLASIGSSYTALGLYSEANPLLERAYSLRKKQLGPKHLDVAESAMQLADVLEFKGQYTDEEKYLREALSIRMSKLPESDRRVSATLSQLGQCLYLQSRAQEAEPILRKAIAISQDDSDSKAGAQNYLALVVETKGDYGEAAQLLRSASESTMQREGADSLDYMTVMHNLAGALSDLGDLNAAEVTERKVLELRRKISGPDHPDTVFSLNNLGWILLEKGDWALAAPYLREALEINSRKLGENHPRFATSLNNWARVLQGKGDYSQAENSYRQALSVLERNNASRSWGFAKIQANLGLLKLDTGDYKSAEQLSQEALELRKQLGGESNPDVASSLLEIGVERSFQNDLAASENYLRQALAIRKQIFPPSHLRLVAAEVRLGEVLTSEGKLSEAEDLLHESVNSAHRSPFPLLPWQVAEAENAYGICLMRSGKTAEGRAIVQKSTDALRSHPEAALRKLALARSAALLNTK